MKHKNKIQAFTLVELIVVITILAIIGTIAFISLEGYASQARDSKRVSDIQNIKTSLELFSLNTGKYPTPDTGFDVIYDSDIVWIQGIVGDNVTTNLSRNLNEKPTDPLTETEYTYSVIGSRTQYELLSIYESELISYNDLLNTTKAANQAYPKIDGTYNQIFVKTSNYYIPTPSIITSETLPLDFNISPEKITSQIITGGKNNITYSQEPATTEGLIGFTLQAFSGTLDTDNGEDEGGNKALLAQAFIAAYSGSILENVGIYKQIVETSGTDNLILLIDDVILSSGTYYSSGGGDNIPLFICGTSTVSAGGETYTTILGPDGNCWTSQNMNHGTIVNGSTMLSDIDTIEKWCYDNNSANCISDGGLYTWSEAMGFDDNCNTINCTQEEDTTKSVCGQLGTGWKLPTNIQWTALTNAGATGWKGNRLSGIVSSLPGFRLTNASFVNYNINGFWWSSTEDSTINSWPRYLGAGDDIVYGDSYNKAVGLSVVCIKN